MKIINPFKKEEKTSFFEINPEFKEIFEKWLKREINFSEFLKRFNKIGEKNYNHDEDYDYEDTVSDPSWRASSCNIYHDD